MLEELNKLLEEDMFISSRIAKTVKFSKRVCSVSCQFLVQKIVALRIGYTQTSIARVEASLGTLNILKKNF